MPRPGYRRVTFTKEELIEFGLNADRLILDRLRSLGVPAKGNFCFEGVRYGVMRAKYDKDNDERIIEWWETAEAAAADGVDLPEKDSAGNALETSNCVGPAADVGLVLPGDDGYDSRFGNR